MGIRECGQNYLCVKDWPDKKRFKRKYPNRRQAENMLTRIEASILNGNWREFREQISLRNLGTVKLKDYAEAYLNEYAMPRNKPKSVARKRTSFNALNKHMGNLDLEAIIPARVHNYVKNRKKDGTSDATVNRDVTILKHLLTYAEECGVIKVNPIEKFKLLKEERRERPRFTDEEVQAVIGALRPDVRPLFIFIKETGCRREEGLSLQHWQVQEESGLVVFSDNTKSKKFRYVPLTEAALEAVKVLPKLDGCPYVFYNLSTKNRWCECRKPWNNARKEANVPGFLIKDLRRLYAIKLAEGGAEMHDIQQVLGHATVSTTERYYAQFSPKHSARKILKVLNGNKSKELTRNSAQYVSQKAAVGQ